MSKTIKMKSLSPSEYRLFKKRDGEVVLQGSFISKDDNKTTIVWDAITIPVVEERHLELVGGIK